MSLGISGIVCGGDYDVSRIHQLATGRQRKSTYKAVRRRHGSPTNLRTISLRTGICFDVGAHALGRHLRHNGLTDLRISSDDSACEARETRAAFEYSPVHSCGALARSWRSIIEHSRLRESLNLEANTVCRLRPGARCPATA